MKTTTQRDEIELDCDAISEDLDRIENLAGDLYVTYFESPLYEFPNRYATIFRKSLARIAEMIEQMMQEVQ